MFSWGSGALGQLGLGMGAGDALRPAHVTELSAASGHNARAAQVACGMNHSVVVATDGRVFAWGHSEYGQTAGGDGARALLPSDARVDGHHAVAGGDLGRHASRHYFLPREIVELRGAGVRSVACGAQFSVAHTSAGIVTWGWCVARRARARCAALRRIKA